MAKKIIFLEMLPSVILVLLSVFMSILLLVLLFLIFPPIILHFFIKEKRFGTTPFSPLPRSRSHTDNLDLRHFVKNTPQRTVYNSNSTIHSAVPSSNFF